MGEYQCPHCGHITTGFEHQDFEARQHEIECLRARIAELEAAQGTRVPEGYVLVPKDDPSRPFADPLLPIAMVKVGEDAIDKADEDLRNYVSGETIDWDSGMIAVAVWRAMCAAAPPAPSAPSREKMTEAQWPAWRPIAEWDRTHGRTVIGFCEEWGVAEFTHHDDGWTIATFNGSIKRYSPLVWMPRPSDESALAALHSALGQEKG